MFIDSSVLISAAISSQGYARDLILRGLRADLILLWSTHVVEETERNLKAKAPTALAAFERFRDRLNLELVVPEEATIQPVTEFVDPKDAPIVAVAVQCQATWIASYDRRHLLSQREIIAAQFGITVATPDEILSSLT